MNTIRYSPRAPKPSCLLYFFLFLISHFCNGQHEKTYYPRKTYSSTSTDLISDIKAQLYHEIRSMGRTNEVVRNINEGRINLIVRMIKAGAFIKDDSIETYVTAVMERIAEANGLPPFSRRVLIAKSPYVNALCYGQGIYVVTVSLLGRISNENQLAFVMAHEIAHDELGHVRQKILQEGRINLSRKTQEQFYKIVKGKIELEDIENFRSVLYDVSRYSRKKEIEADSMALVLLHGAKYNKREALSMLSILNTPQEPKYEIGLDIFLPFHSEDFPFQEYWLNERLSLYKKKHTGSLMYSADSVGTHPSIEARMEAVNFFSAKNSIEDDLQSLEFADAVTEAAEFETVESAYRNKAYDLCMYYSLQLLNRFPKNNYLISRIGKVLIDLLEDKIYLERYTAYYSDELRLVNNFLFNLTKKELGELAFHFLNNKNHFNTTEKSHYYLLWKTCDLTYRHDVKEKVKKDYHQVFGKSITAFEFK